MSKNTAPVTTSTGFIILPSHFRGRLDTERGVVKFRQQVLCGAHDTDGFFTCSDEVAYVIDYGRPEERELAAYPGWVFEGPFLRPTKNQIWRHENGKKPAFRNKVVTRSEGRHKGKRFQPSMFLTQFLPVVAVCYHRHINILEADRLNVLSHDEVMRAYGLT